MESERRIHDLEQRVAVLTEAVNRALAVRVFCMGRWYSLEDTEGNADTVVALRAALSATAGTEAERVPVLRLRKLEAVAAAVRYAMRRWPADDLRVAGVVLALRDLDAEAEASGGSDIEGGKE